MLSKQWIRRFLAPNRCLSRKKMTIKRNFSNDTIYALSSAQGRAGVAIVRVSGAMAETCLQRLTQKEILPLPRR
jgi:hypothetical protein